MDFRVWSENGSGMAFFGQKYGQDLENLDLLQVDILASGASLFWDFFESLARNRALILYISFRIFDFGPEKSPGLSRNGPQV